MFVCLVYSQALIECASGGHLIEAFDDEELVVNVTKHDVSVMNLLTVNATGEFFCFLVVVFFFVFFFFFFFFYFPDSFFFFFKKPNF